MAWFAVRGVIRFGEVYEERIVVFDASDFDEAIAKAEVEIAEYAGDPLDGEPLDLFQAFKLFDDLEDGAEVFSLMRDSPLDAEGYLDRFFDTGAERMRPPGC